MRVSTTPPLFQHAKYQATPYCQFWILQRLFRRCKGLCRVYFQRISPNHHVEAAEAGPQVHGLVVVGCLLQILTASLEYPQLDWTFFPPLLVTVVICLLV